MASLSLTGQGFKPRKSKGKPLGRAVKPKVTAEQAWELMAEKFSSRFRKVKDAFVKMDMDCTGFLSAEEFRFTLRHVLGLELDDDEYKKFWDRFDTTGDGRVDYAEFNNRLGHLIHPPAGQILMNRPETPRIKEWQRKRMAAAVKTKMKNLEKSFKEIDTDGSGSISHAEFIQALRKMGLTKIGNEESYQMMRKYKAKDDTSEDMSWEEFKKTMQDYLHLPDLPDDGMTVDKKSGLPLLKLSDAEKIIADKLYGKFAHVQKAFRMFDEDKSGSLDHEEFKLAMRSLGVNLSERDFRTLCMQYDKSGDGTISYDEFNARVGPLIHPDAANRNKMFIEMGDAAGAQADALHFNPHARLGLNALDEDGHTLSQSARARLVAPRLGLVEGEAIFARKLYGKYAEVQKTFREMDTDSSGALDEKEFKEFLKVMDVKLSKAAFAELMTKYDTTGDGEISYDEFNAVIGPLLTKSPFNSAMLGLDEEKEGKGDGDGAEDEGKDDDEGAAASASASASAAAPPAPRRVVEETTPRRATKARGVAPLALPGSGKKTMGSRRRPSSAHPAKTRKPIPSAKAVPMLPLGDASMTRGPGSVRSYGSRPMSAASARRKTGHLGMKYDRTTGHVPAVRRRPTRKTILGEHLPEDMGASAKTAEVDVDATVGKMRRILGKSWTVVYDEIRKEQEHAAPTIISAHRFRDAMAERGVPLTSKEVRALAKRFSATHDPMAAGRELDYDRLLRTSFERPRAAE